MLAPRAIALQGVGYAPRALALQGLWAVETTISLDAPVFLPGRPQQQPKRKKKRHQSQEEVFLIGILL